MLTHRRLRTNRRRRLLLESGSLTASWNFADNRNLLGDGGGVLGTEFSFTRASTATCFDSNGILKTVAIDEPRFDYNPGTLASRGLLIENDKTNRLTYSNDVSQWTNVRSTDDNAAGTGPDGETSAQAIISDASVNDTHYVSRSVSLLAFTQYALSAFVKKGARDWVLLQASGVGVSGPGYYFNLATGEIGSPTGVSATKPKLQACPNGWYRASFQFTSGTPSSPLMLIAPSAGNGSTSYTGTLTEDTYFFGAQLEFRGLSSYIPTAASTVTRSKDVCTSDDVEFLGNITTEEGTMYGAGEPYSLNVPNSALLSQFDDGNSSDRLLLYRDASGKPTCATVSSGGSTGFVVGPTADEGSIIKMAMSYAANDVRLSLDGTIVGSDSSATLPLANAPSSLRVGSIHDGTLQWDGWIRDLRFYNEARDNVALNELTSG